MEPTTPIPTSEDPALESLKSKINDSSLPTLDLARAFQQHPQLFPQTQKALSEKLQVKESTLSEMVSLLRLPPPALQKIEGQGLGLRDIRKIKSSVESVESPVESVESSVESVEPAVEPVESVENGVELPKKDQINDIQRVYSSKERLNTNTEAIEVVRNPEKSDAASDAAAGILKKIIPW